MTNPEQEAPAFTWGSLHTVSPASKLPGAAVRAAAEAMQEEEDTRTWPSWERLARIALEAAEPLRIQREEEVRADERRKVAEEIAAALLAVDPVEWALAGQQAGLDAARIARQIGEAHGDA